MNIFFKDWNNYFYLDYIVANHPTRQTNKDFINRICLCPFMNLVEERNPGLYDVRIFRVYVAPSECAPLTKNWVDIRYKRPFVILRDERNIFFSNRICICEIQIDYKICGCLIQKGNKYISVFLIRITITKT